MTDDAQSVGKKIAAARKNKLKLSQKEFGARINRSEAWVSQVERGVRPINQVPVLELVAAEIGVPVAELMPAGLLVSATASKPRAVSDLALALTASSALRVAVAAARATEEPVDVAKLIAESARAWELAHGSAYGELGEMLLDLLPQLEIGTRRASGDEQQALFRALTKAYHAAAAVLAKLGETSAAWVAADRAVGAAERSGDLLLMAEGAFRLTLVFQGARWLELAQATAEQAEETLVGLDDLSLAARSLRGALNLQLAVVAARSDNADQAYARLDVAAGLAEQNGEDRDDYDTEFGPTNVALHKVAVALELGDAGQALRVGEAVDASGLSRERQARLLIDLARAHDMRRNLAGVVTTLTAADELAPEQVRNHPIVQGLMADLAQTPAATDAAFIELNRRLSR